MTEPLTPELFQEIYDKVKTEKPKPFIWQEHPYWSQIVELFEIWIPIPNKE
jgi:pyruvate formate-lyase activating enzyme-like uncharacterized protein